ncbi:MAG TPA: hypothetical protein VKY54_15840 [Kiloniellales bacterium]|nr:hypothetical protein [Kiloniellales bacterium]
MDGKSIAQMRAEFEAAYAEFSVRTKGFSDDEVKIALMRDDDGGYLYGAANEAWWAWQASRASLVVELPAAKQVTHAGAKWIGAIAEQEYRDACRAAIEDAGVKVKA